MSGLMVMVWWGDCSSELEAKGDLFTDLNRRVQALDFPMALSLSGINVVTSR